MDFFYGKQDIPTLAQGQKTGFLLTNGLGGYASQSLAFSAPRCDSGLLVAALRAPNVRVTMVHRLRETLKIGEREYFLSSQTFSDGTAEEDGLKHQSWVQADGIPCWSYHMGGVTVTRRCVMAQGENASALVYTVENRSSAECTLTAEPFCKLAPKEDALRRKKAVSFRDGWVSDRQYRFHVAASTAVEGREPLWQRLSYPEDKLDGRPGSGLCVCVCGAEIRVPQGQTAAFELVFSTDGRPRSGSAMLAAEQARLAALEEKCPLKGSIARQLVRAADAYISHRDSTNGKTILAGYPLFSDWGRDTMIALTGCTLVTGRYEDARSILRTFLSYEKDGLVPNLFPEGGHAPMYNTVDAALLLIDGVWQYYSRTGDLAFVREAYPTLARIAAAYRAGTHHGIGMDSDGLIFAGQGLDQVTWMDVCVQGILPTPRHGKPVEINAYWYSALRILDIFAEKLGEDRLDYALLAQRVRTSFLEKFWIPEKGYLRDVLSGTEADEQLRCNQIWAVSMPFTMLPPELERQVVDAVGRELYTPCGLRTLSPRDPQYRGHYGGPQLDRDLAYHQGTVWVFPMGAYYLAWLKVHGHSPEAVSYVRRGLRCLEPMLREGCAGQLPEIYDGDHPTHGKGCYAQAWSVGEMLRVCEAVESPAGK